MHGFKYIFKYTYIKNIYFLLVAGRNQYSVISVRCCSVRSVCIHLSTYIGTHTYRKPNGPQESLHPFHSQDKHMTVG